VLRRLAEIVVINIANSRNNAIAVVLHHGLNLDALGIFCFRNLQRSQYRGNYQEDTLFSEKTA
jgi:hypothetical protein